MTVERAEVAAEEEDAEEAKDSVRMVVDAGAAMAQGAGGPPARTALNGIRNLLPASQKKNKKNLLKNLFPFLSFLLLRFFLLFPELEYSTVLRISYLRAQIVYFRRNRYPTVENGILPL